MQKLWKVWLVTNQYSIFSWEMQSMQQVSSILLNKCYLYHWLQSLIAPQARSRLLSHRTSPLFHSTSVKQATLIFCSCQKLEISGFRRGTPSESVDAENVSSRSSLAWVVCSAPRVRHRQCRVSSSLVTLFLTALSLMCINPASSISFLLAEMSRWRSLSSHSKHS